MEMNFKDIVALGNDVRRNRVAGNFSLDQANSVLHDELVRANGGKDRLDIRDIRDGKCSNLFAIVEQVVSDAKHDLLTEDAWFKQYVDYRNLAYGDKLEIKSEGGDMFVVSEIGSGSQAIRRQRLTDGASVSIDTSWKAIKIYEEIELLLANRVDWTEAIDRVVRSFANNTFENIYTAWNGAIAGLVSPYAATGSFTEAVLVNMIQHVKAANGTRDVYIMGSLGALNKVVGSIDSTAIDALNSKYQNGFVGRFAGVPKMELQPIHKAGTDTLLLNDNTVYVMAANVKPIVYVTEGTSLILPNNFANNVDLTQEYLMMEKTGVGVRVPDGEGKWGRYVIS